MLCALLLTYTALTEKFILEFFLIESLHQHLPSSKMSSLFLQRLAIFQYCFRRMVGSEHWIRISQIKKTCPKVIVSIIVALSNQEKKIHPVSLALKGLLWLGSYSCQIYTVLTCSRVHGKLITTIIFVRVWLFTRFIRKRF